MANEGNITFNRTKELAIIKASNELLEDVKRGLYMESIPSTFIFKVNMAQWAHVYRVRSKNGTANPEVKQLAEMLQDEIEKQMPWFDREFIKKVEI